jgi:TldD protein
MISREPTIERLAIAQRLLLEPFGLDESHLARALTEIRAHKVDDADLYFQYTRSEGWSLEEGIVKTGSFSIDQGVGVRAVSGEKTAFAYSDDISEASLLDAARTPTPWSMLKEPVFTIPSSRLQPSLRVYWK